MNSVLNINAHIYKSFDNKVIKYYNDKAFHLKLDTLQ